MKQVYLHIGFHKTGTTYIQNLFHLNREYFEKNNILYPQVINSFAYHHPIFQNITDKVNNDHIWDIGEDFRDFEFHEKKFINSIKSSSADNIIISSEIASLDVPIFAHVINDNLKVISYLDRLFSEFDVKIIMYVREPISYITSCYSESVTGAHTCSDLTFESFSSSYAKDLINYEALIMRWIECFGDENVYLRSYDKFKNDKLGIFKDILSIIDPHFTIDKTEFTMLDSDNIKNASYNKDWLSFLCAFNAINKKQKIGNKYNFPYTIDDIVNHSNCDNIFTYKKYLNDNFEKEITTANEFIKVYCDFDVVFSEFTKNNNLSHHNNIWELIVPDLLSTKNLLEHKNYLLLEKSFEFDKLVKLKNEIEDNLVAIDIKLHLERDKMAKLKNKFIYRVLRKLGIFD